MTTIGANKVVFIHYTLTDGDGNEIDSSLGGEPMPYLHGYDNIVPGLERQLEGKAAGDHVKAVVPAAEGYGEVSGIPPQPVPIEAFEDVMPEAGMPIVVESDDGKETQLWIDSVDEERVILSHDHPLAGVDLHFEVEIVKIRDATKVELEHGHVHEGDGHHHHH